ncbi:hypothetical protein ACSRUE_16910 [Sorangium sp. KYC3313]|uniref:hypothetical protein n=1 Tax=Sorangium sp. KYC3313 TaxID=3449740 RepID=UPI003F8B336E
MRDVAPSLLFCLMLGAAAACTSPASAEDIYSTLELSGSSTVKDHVRRAQRARDAGRWTEAHAAYKAAFEATDPASSTEKERAQLDALAVGILRKKVNWVLDADIRDFFNTIDHGWMVKFVEHRIADRRILRLIQK